CGKKSGAPTKLSRNPRETFLALPLGWPRAIVTLPQRGWSHPGPRPLAMTSRTRFLITAAFVCHLLLAPSIVTSQLLSAAEQGGMQPTSSSPPPSAPSSINAQDVTIRALQQERNGAVFKLRGQAEIHYGTYVLYADAVDYNSDTGEATADGHVVLDGGPNDEHVEATHGAYNVRTEAGRFEHVSGTTG